MWLYVGLQGGGLVVLFNITEVSVNFIKTACKCQNIRVKYCYSLFLLDRIPNLSSTIIISIFHCLIKMSAVYVAVKNEQSCILTVNINPCRPVQKIYLGVWRVSFHTSPSYAIVCNHAVT